MKTVLIIEDNKTQLEMLKKLVLEVNKGVVVYTASESKAAYQILIEKDIDVFLVDIILDATKPGDTSGVKLVEKIRTITKYMFTPVIFVTSLEDATKYTYTHLNCLGYVEKPFAPEQVKGLVKRALHFSTGKEPEEDAVYCFRKEGILFPIKVKNILYIESINHVVNIYLKEGGSLTIPYIPCKQLLEDINVKYLIQCSRNAIVNKEYVQNIDLTNRCISLHHTPNQVIIGVTYKKRVLAEFRHDH